MTSALIREQLNIAAAKPLGRSGPVGVTDRSAEGLSEAPRQADFGTRYQYQ